MQSIKKPVFNIQQQICYKPVVLNDLLILWTCRSRTGSQQLPDNYSLSSSLYLVTKATRFRSVETCLVFVR